MSGGFRFAFCLIVFLASGSVSRANALKFDQTTITRQASAEDKKLEIVFPFTNTGTDTVTVSDIRTSCGCTTAQLPKKAYAPGEKGEVRAVFTVGKRKGTQEKTILVQTAEKGAVPYILTLRVDLPDPVKINKQTLTWQAGDPLESQSFEVTVSDPKAAQVLGVRTFSKEFNLMLEEVEAGKTYRISVTPSSTDQPGRATVLLYVADPEKRTIALPVTVE